jgi:Helix-turn-helix domain
MAGSTNPKPFRFHEQYAAGQAVRVKPRTFSPHLLKSNYSYSLEQIADLYGVGIATIRRWIRVDGLKRVPHVRPYLVHSTELKSFLERRQRDRRHPCAPNEVFCLRCRLPRTPQPGTGTVEPLPNTAIRFRAECSACGGKILKTISRADWSKNHPLADLLRDAPEQHSGMRS